MNKRNPYRDELSIILHKYFNQGYRSVSEFPIDVRIKVDELNLRSILYSIETIEFKEGNFKTYSGIFNIISPRFIGDSIAKMKDKHCRS